MVAFEIGERVRIEVPANLTPAEAEILANYVMGIYKCQQERKQLDLDLQQALLELACK